MLASHKEDKLLYPDDHLIWCPKVDSGPRTLAKSRYNSKMMERICTANQKVITDMNQILEAQYQYYDKLYTKNDCVKFQVRNRTGVAISVEQKHMLDKPISLEQLHVAVKQFPVDKTPGVDALTSEFYVHFWDKIADVYHKAILFTVGQGELHISARRGILSLIPKRGCDLLFIKNWRPLTMLMLDYRIFSKAL